MTLIEAIETRLDFRRPSWGDTWVNVDQSHGHYFVEVVDYGEEQFAFGEEPDITADDYEVRACPHEKYLYTVIHGLEGSYRCGKCGARKP